MERCFMVTSLCDINNMDESTNRNIVPYLPHNPETDHLRRDDNQAVLLLASDFIKITGRSKQ